MSRSKEALDRLEKAVLDVQACAESTLGGVGMACFITVQEQAEAIEIAKAKLSFVNELVKLVTHFKNQYGDFN